MLQEGAAAPEFEVQGHAGRTVRLSDYRGRSVVLWFYPKADTPGGTARRTTRAPAPPGASAT